MIDAGEVKARGDITGGRDRANALLMPFMESGSRATTLRDDMLGINGPEAQAAAYASFQHDPGFEAELQGGINALDRSATARGGLYSGAAIKGAHDYGRTKIGESFQRRLSALMPVAEGGRSTAGAAAGMEYDTGARLGDLSWGAAGTRASNRIGLGNNLAASRGIGFQNALNLAGTAAKFLSPSPIK